MMRLVYGERLRRRAKPDTCGPAHSAEQNASVTDVVVFQSIRNTPVQRGFQRPSVQHSSAAERDNSFRSTERCPSRRVEQVGSDRVNRGKT